MPKPNLPRGIRKALKGLIPRLTMTLQSLSGLRAWSMPPSDLKHNSLKGAIEYDGEVYRSVRLKDANPRNVLSTEGTKKWGGRYNYKDSFDVLYVSCDPHTCLEESTYASMNIGISLAGQLPRTVVPIQVHLSKVMDLTNAETRRRIGIKESILKETDWRAMQEKDKKAITQKIGEWARDAGFDALLVPSAVYKGNNLAIFMDNVDLSNLIPLNLT